MSYITIAPPTTTFTPPSFCKTHLLLYSSGFGELHRDKTCGSDGVPTYAPECFPVGDAFVSAQNQPYDVFYSSLFDCPVGYTTACTESMTLYSGVTKVGCCPSGYTCFGGRCNPDASFLEFSRTKIYYCDGTRTESGDIMFTEGSEFADFSTGGPTTVRVDLSQRYGLQLQMISNPSVTGSSARSSRESTRDDSATSTTALNVNTGSALSPAPSSPGTIPAVSAGLNAGDQASPKSGGLSNGAKIGIGVAVPICIFLLFLISFLLIRRRRKRLSATTGPSTSQDSPNWEKAELQGDMGVAFGGKAHAKAELDTSTKQIEPTGALLEKDASSTKRHEMEASQLPKEFAAEGERSQEGVVNSEARQTSATQKSQQEPPWAWSTPYEIFTSHDEEEKLRVKDLDVAVPTRCSQDHPKEPVAGSIEGNITQGDRQSIAGRTAKLAELEAKKARIAERLARARQLADLEAEESRLQAEIQRLRKTELLTSWE